MTGLALTTGRPLTATQIRMLALLADGHTQAEIAQQIGRSKSAMSMALSNLYARLGARNGTQAVAIAIRNGLIPATTDPAGDNA